MNTIILYYVTHKFSLPLSELLTSHRLPLIFLAKQTLEMAPLVHNSSCNVTTNSH